MGEGKGYFLVSAWQSQFPNLGNDYRETSPADIRYNCIAWAAEDNSRWWWPERPKKYWPKGVRRGLDLDSFVAAFSALGYRDCDNGDLEPGIQKVALYGLMSGEVKHAARQLPDGKWTSKLGEHEDIEHELTALYGNDYGYIHKFMSRSTDRKQR